MNLTDHPRISDRSVPTAGSTTDLPVAASGVAAPTGGRPSTGAVFTLWGVAEARIDAEEAERDLASAIGAFAQEQLALDLEGRRAVVRMIREHGGRNGDKHISRILAKCWTAEHVRLYGPAPSPRSVRRWLRISSATGSPPVRPYSPSAAGGSGGAPAGAGSPPVARFAPGARQAPMEEEVALRVAALPPAIRKPPAPGDVIEVDGVRLLCLGRTTPGRVLVAEVDVPEGAHPVVRVLEPGDSFTPVTIH